MQDTTTPTQARPLCFPTRHMSGNEYSVYDVARAKSHQSEDHILFFDGREMAAEFGTMSKSTAYRAAHSLEQKGWFKLVKASTRRPTDGTWSATHYKVLSHQEWEQEHPDGCPTKRNLKKTIKTPPVPPEGLVTVSPVPKNASPVPKNASPVPLEGHNCSNNLSINFSSPIHTNKGTPVQIWDTTSVDQDRKAPAGISSAPQPVPPEGLDRLQVARLASTVTRAFTNHGEAYEQEWRTAVQHLLSQGNSPDDVLKMIAAMKEAFTPATVEKEGGDGFLSFLKQKHYDTPQGAAVFIGWVEQQKEVSK